MSREHLSLATAVRDELNLAIALGHKGAHLVEIGIVVTSVPWIVPLMRTPLRYSSCELSFAVKQRVTT
jgi:hypothetical protein